MFAFDHSVVQDIEVQFLNSQAMLEIVGELETQKMNQEVNVYSSLQSLLGHLQEWFLPEQGHQEMREIFFIPTQWLYDLKPF